MDFNEAQIKAVRHGDGPMLLLAGPGSGKTTVITHRIRYMTNELKLKPSEILVVTFTRAAADEMRTRFERLCGGGGGVTFGTFHSVFFYILRSVYGYSVSDIATDAEKCGVIKDSIERHGFRYEGQEDFVRLVAGEIGLVKGEGLDVRGYESRSMKADDFAVVYEEYELFLRNRGKLDFEDMLVFTYELLSKRQDVLDAWRRRYRYILIDEFQDINRLQYDVVKLLAGQSKNVFAVGDDDQSIYGFRGAAPSIMKSFVSDFPGAALECLNVNYRCSSDIVECSRRIIENNKDRYDKPLMSAFDPGRGERVHVIKTSDAQEQNRMIAQRLAHLNGEGIPFSKMAVIYRTNSEPRGLAAKLTERGIPFSMKDSIPNIFRHFIAVSVLDYIRASMGQMDRSIILRIINKPNRYIKREAFTDSVVSLEALREYYKESYRIVGSINTFENDLARIKGMTPYAAVNYIRKGVGLDSYVKEYAGYRGVSPDDYMDVLDEVLESAREFTTFDGWFSYIDEYTAGLYEGKKDVRQKDAVTLATMHGVKGLEFDHVIIMDAVEGVTPHKKSVDEERVEEERRMFYVAVTRARYSLSVYVPGKLYGKKTDISRFVEEMLVDRSLIKTGGRIVHKKYGQGVITYADDSRLCVYFERLSETKTLSLSYTLKNGLISPLS